MNACSLASPAPTEANFTSGHLVFVSDVAASPRPFEARYREAPPVCSGGSAVGYCRGLRAISPPRNREVQTSALIGRPPARRRGEASRGAPARLVPGGAIGSYGRLHLRPIMNATSAGTATTPVSEGRRRDEKTNVKTLAADTLKTRPRPNLPSGAVGFARANATEGSRRPGRRDLYPDRPRRCDESRRAS
jgi:hypothetical protein